jgi:hypothetical protein
MKCNAVRGISHDAVHGLGIDRPFDVRDRDILRRRGIGTTGARAATPENDQASRGKQQTKTSLGDSQGFHDASRNSSRACERLAEIVYELL